MTLEQINEEFESSLNTGGCDRAQAGTPPNFRMECNHIKDLRESPESEMTWLSRYIREPGGELVDVRTCSACARIDPKPSLGTMLYRISWPMLVYKDSKKNFKRKVADGFKIVARTERGRQDLKDIFESS
jgi:hypothetical protein